MLKKVIAAMLDKMFKIGMNIINDAEYWYDFTSVGGELMPEYWDEYEWGNGLMDTAMDLGGKVGYNSNDAMWEDEIEYRV